MLKKLFCRKKQDMDHDLLEEITEMISRDPEKAVNILIHGQAYRNGFYMSDDAAVAHDVFCFTDADYCKAWVSIVVDADNGLMAINVRKQLAPGKDTCRFMHYTYDTQSVREALK